MLIQARSLDGDYLTFDEDRHSYILNGEVVPSVTTINKCAYPESFELSAWKVKQGSLATVDLLKQIPLPVVKLPEDFIKEVVKTSGTYSKRIAKEAADIGSIVHDYAEQWESTGKITEELKSRISTHIDKDKIIKCVDKFKEWKDTNKDEIIGHENIIASTIYNVAGKYDRLSHRGKLTVLSDFKTSSGIYIDQFIQLAAYRLMLKSFFGIQVDMIEVLRFGKGKGEFEVHSIKNPKKLDLLEEQFIRNVKTYNFIKEVSV
jgi:hypothetical protein